MICSKIRIGTRGDDLQLLLKRLQVRVKGTLGTGANWVQPTHNPVTVFCSNLKQR